jgi:hypothetical protein
LCVCVCVGGGGCQYGFLYVHGVVAVLQLSLPHYLAACLEQGERTASDAAAATQQLKVHSLEDEVAQLSAALRSANGDLVSERDRVSQVSLALQDALGDIDARKVRG